jgi:hypothetical protein
MAVALNGQQNNDMPEWAKGGKITVRGGIKSTARLRLQAHSTVAASP